MAQNIQHTSSLTQTEIEQLIGDRRKFHSHPELAYNEQLTARVVADRLSELGYEVKTEVGRTGVVGLLEGAKTASGADSADGTPNSEASSQGRTLLYRADMDALPIEEENSVDYRSQNPGVMPYIFNLLSSILQSTCKSSQAR